MALMSGLTFTYFAFLGALLLLIARLYHPKLLRGGVPVPEILLPVAARLADSLTVLNAWSGRLSFDAYLYNFEAAYGFQASYIVGRLFEKYILLKYASGLVYCALPLAAAVVYLYLPEGAKVRFFVAMALAGVLGFVLYRLLPASGPVYTGANFPWNEPAMLTAARTQAIAPLNAIPSLHLAWALLLFLFARELGRAWELGTGLWLMFTVLATLGFGQHYLIDLIVGVPFAVVVWSLVLRPRVWLQPTSVLLSVAAFMMLLRLGHGAELQQWVWVVSGFFLVEAALLLSRDRIRCGRAWWARLRRLTSGERP